MARKPVNFKAQLITVNGNDTIKRSFNKMRSDISDDELGQIAQAINVILPTEEHLHSMNLTANSSLEV